MADPIDPARIVKLTRDYGAGYLDTPVTPKRSVRAAWWAFCRGLGYGLARIVLRGLK